LNEVTDVTPTALSDSQVTVTLNEYGNAVVTTAKLRGTAFLDVDSAAANIIGYNAGDSIDQVVREVLAGGTNVVYATGGSTTPTSRESVSADDILSADDGIPIHRHPDLRDLDPDLPRDLGTQSLIVQYSNIILTVNI
jgi:N4-gp56 family major capsid protein